MHKFRKIGRRLLAAALAASMIFSIEAFATESEIKKQQAQTQKQLDAINQEMKSIESQRDSVLAEIDSLNSDLVDLMLNIEMLESDLQAKEEELAQAQTDYEAAKQKEEEQYEAMKLRIQYIYEEGDMDYLTLVFGGGQLHGFPEPGGFRQRDPDQGPADAGGVSGDQGGSRRAA